MTSCHTRCMTTISVRVSEEEKKDLEKHGNISKVVREAITLYLTSTKSKETIERLKELQQSEKAKTTKQEEATLIRKDRRR